MMPDQNAPTIEESLAKVGTKLKAEPSYRACIAQSVQMCGSQAVSQVTRDGKDATACNIFEDPSLKATCSDAINTELAQKSLDTTLCDKVSSTSKASCVRQITVTKAIQTKDIKVCAALKPPKVENTTTGVVMPPLMDTSEESQCVLQVIMTMDASDATLKDCDTLDDEMIRTQCTQSVKSRIEMEKNMPIPPKDIPNPPKNLSIPSSMINEGVPSSATSPVSR